VDISGRAISAVNFTTEGKWLWMTDKHGTNCLLKGPFIATKLNSARLELSSLVSL